MRPKRSPGRRGKALDLRREPTQTRGHATFDHILDTTGRLLDELGLERVNTNVIARAAGVNIATLYQYFPNKQAVLLALYQRQSRQRAETAQELFTGLSSNPDWPSQVDAMVDGMALLRKKIPGLAALMQAMRVEPELRDHHLREGERIAGLLAAELVRGGRLSAERAAVVARCAIEANVALIDLWQFGSKGKDNRILDELKQLHRRFLAPHLAAPTRQQARRKRSRRPG